MSFGEVQLLFVVPNKFDQEKTNERKKEKTRLFSLSASACFGHSERDDSRIGISRGDGDGDRGGFARSLVFKSNEEEEVKKGRQAESL